MPLASLAALIAAPALAAEAPARPLPSDLAHTFSIVTRDAETGALGAAVQTHWFNVGASVIWAEAGVGAVATQSFTDPSYGPLGLEMMAAGKTAEQALEGLLGADETPQVRQVGMVGADGSVANFTGEDAIEEHCEIRGETYSIQANLMWKPGVCEAMEGAFTGTEGDLAERMMAALNAAQAAGGDIRGKQSAALLMVEGEAGTPKWKAETFNLRVDDHAEPLVELQRLLTTARAYRHMNRGDEYFAAGDVEAALDEYSTAQRLAPGNHEMVFWQAVTLASSGDVEAAMPLFAEAYEAWPQWRELVPRLPESGLLPDDEALIARIVAAE